MSYKQDSLIEASDYNTYVGTTTSTVANALNTVNSTGAKQYGYGQPAVAEVTKGNKVAPANWNLLINKIDNLAKHQGSTITPVTLTASGNPIVALTTPAPITSIFENNLNVIYTNSGNAIAQGTSAATTTTKPTTWYNHTGFTHEIAFVSGDAARYFFNAGGQLSLSFIHPAGPAGDTTNNSWNSLAASAGKLVISSPTSGSVSIAGKTYTGVTQLLGTSGSTILTTAGYHSLSTTDQLIYRKANDLGAISVSIKSNGTRGTASDSGNIITITTKWDRLVEGFAADGTFPSAGTAVSVAVISPATTYLTNTWGTPTVTGTEIIGTDVVVQLPTITASWDTNPIVVPGSATISWTATNATYVKLGSTGETQYPVIGSLLYADLGPKRYTYADGFSQEYDIEGNNPGQPLWLAQEIGSKIYASNTQYTTTGGGKRYGLYRSADSGGVAYWTKYCITNSIPNPTVSQKFIDEFFLVSLGSTADANSQDSVRSFQATKEFILGDAFGDFSDRPPNSGYWGIDPYSYKFGWIQEFTTAYPAVAANLTLAKKIVDNFYSGSGKFTSTARGNQYTLTSGFPEESGFAVGTPKHTLAVEITKIYKSISTVYTTTLDVVAPATSPRYGYGRAPDYPGLIYWVNRCATDFNSEFNGITFLSNFFGGAGEPDLSRSKTNVKTYNPGEGYGDFLDRPTNLPGDKYALYRKPDAEGLAFWVTWCLTPSLNNTGGQVLSPETNQSFINSFFNVGDGDIERSKTQTKKFDEGGGFGNFYDRPLIDPTKIFNRDKTFTETITAVGPGGTKTITI